MSWALLLNNQTVSRNNLIDAVANGVFTALTTIPTGTKEITKAEAISYVNLNTSYAPLAAKSSNQLVVKSNLISGSGTTTTTTTSSTASIDWSISRAVGGGAATLVIKDVFNNVLLNVTSTATLQSGTLTPSYTVLPYTATVTVAGSAGANWNVCDITNSIQLHSAFVADTGTDSYTVSPTPLSTSVSVVYGGTPPACPTI